MKGLKSSIRRPYGVKNVHIALLKEENGDATVYDTPVAVKGCENFQHVPQYEESSGYSDNLQDTSLKLIKSFELSATFGEYSTKIASLIAGHDITLGGKIVKSDDMQNEFALMYEVSNSDGTTTYKVFYKTKLSSDGETNNTKGENLEFSKFPLKGKSLPLSNGVIYREFNSSEDLADGVIDEFYKSVLAPNKKILKG